MLFNQIRLSIVIAVALLSACHADVPDESAALLNSERIEARFGSYGVTILSQDTNRRETCLYSLEGAETVCRTIAIVRFAPVTAAALIEPLEKIRAGASLGATLAGAGWSVIKVNRHLGSYDIPTGSDSPVAALFRIRPPARLAVHIYDLRAVRDDRAFDVATLLEVHHPDYMDEAELERIYASLPNEPMPADAVSRWRARLPALATP